MATVTIRARALSGANTNFISIVDKGANRVPIRMLKNDKGDQPMLDLGTIYSRFTAKKQEPQAEAVGILCGTEQAAGIMAAMKAEGYENVFILDCPSNDDTKCVAIKSELDFDSLTFLNNGDRAVAVENAQKMLKDWGVEDYADFAGNMAANGFYANLRVATETLHDGMWSLMENSGVGNRPVEEINTLLQGFNDYVMGLVQAVPESAFKMEKITPLAVDANETTTETATNVEADAGTESEADPAKGESTEAEAVSGATDGTTTTEEVTEEEAEAPTGDQGDDNTATPEPTSAAKSDNQTLQQILEAVNGLKSDMSSLQEAQSTVNTTVNQLTSRVQKAEKTATDAAEAAGSYVADTNDGLESGQKSDDTDGVDHVFRASNIESA